MNGTDRIKLRWIRNWKLPGQERLARYFKPSVSLKNSFKNGIIWLHDEPLALYASADNYIEWTLLSTGNYEPEIEKLIALSLRQGDVALDIGANIGLQSLRMARYTGDTGLVLSFEPLQHLQKKFMANMLLNRFAQIKLLPYALSNYNDEADFSIDFDEWNQGAFSIGQKNAGKKGRQKVQIRKGDELPEIKELTRLDLIKIDVEGFEPDVLTGLAETLAKHRPRIIFEFDEIYWQKEGKDASDCFSFLSGLNYLLYQIQSIGLEPIVHHTDFQSGNIFCIPQN